MIEEEVKRINFKTELAMNVTQKAFHLAGLIKARLLSPVIATVPSDTEEDEAVETHLPIQQPDPDEASEYPDSRNIQVIQ